MVRQQRRRAIQLLGQHQPHQHVRQRQRTQRPLLVGAARSLPARVLRDRRSGRRGRGPARASVRAAARVVPTTTSCRAHRARPPSPASATRPARARLRPGSRAPHRGPCRAGPVRFRPVPAAASATGASGTRRSLRPPSAVRVRRRRSVWLSSRHGSERVTQSRSARADTATSSSGYAAFLALQASPSQQELQMAATRISPAARCSRAAPPRWRWARSAALAGCTRGRRSPPPIPPGMAPIPEPVRHARAGRRPHHRPAAAATATGLQLQHLRLDRRPHGRRPALPRPP